MKAHCKNCGSQMTALKKNKRFCSQRCGDAFRYVPKPKRGKVVPCAFCGKKFYKKPCHIKRSTGQHFCCKKHNISYMKSMAHKLNCVVCGEEFFCQPCQVPMRNRQTCSRECAGKQKGVYAAISMLFETSQGVINRRVRYSSDMKIWRKSVFERDNYICQSCGQRGGYLEADHIKPFAYYPELRFETSNGRTLCRPCHQKTETWGYRGQKNKTKITERVEEESLDVV